MKVASVTPVDSTEIVFKDVPASLLSGMATGHAFVEIYTAAKHEVLLLCALVGGKATVQRGMRGTTAQRWEPDACVCVLDVIPGACPPADDCGACDPLAALTVGDCLVLDRATGRLSVKHTGVRPGEYGGAVVNECGQFVSIPENWPASALPVFDPCCSPGAGGSDTDDQKASEVPYTPILLAPIATGGNVQVVIEQLEAALKTALDGLAAGVGVASLTATLPITVGGTPSAPILGHAPSGLTPGVYDGFTVDAQGHVTGYLAPPLPAPAFGVIAPLTMNFNPGPGALGTYTFAVNPASVGAPGVVQLVDPADIFGNTVPPAAGGYAVTWDGLNQFFQGQAAAIIPRQTLAAGSWLLATGSLVKDGQVSCSATLVGAGVLEVDLAAAAPSVDYQVVATLRGDTAQVWVENLTASKFRIHWTAGGVNSATHLDFHVVELD